MGIFDTAIKVISGQYKATVTDLSADAFGVARVSARRGLIQAADYAFNQANASSLSLNGDIEVSTSFSSGYGAPTLAFFDGATFGAAIKYVRIPMTIAGWRDVTIYVNQTLGVNLTISVYSTDMNTVAAYSESIATGFPIYLSALAGGTGTAANNKVVPSLSNPQRYLVMGFLPASSPGSGSLQLTYIRRS